MSKTTNVLAKMQSKAYASKHQTYVCDQCGERGAALRGVSVLYLVLYMLGGISAFFLTRSVFLSIAVPFAFTAINIAKVKPRCKSCGSYDVRLLRDIEEDRGNVEDNDGKR